ncbi:MAG: FMN-binding protein [Clostridia bacterium]|nr:FMN-binding protein [Clostridia bacterium]
MSKFSVNKDSVKLVIILACIALVSSLLLAVINIFTQVDEEAKLREAIGEAYSSPLTEEVIDFSSYDNIEKAEILNMFRAEDGAVVILSKSTNCYGAGTGISLIVVIKGNDIVEVVSYSHGETPGLGTNALTEEYLAKYEAFNVSDFVIDGTDATPNGYKKVENYTGATKSSNGVRDAVTNAVRAYVKVAKENA